MRWLIRDTLLQGHHNLPSIYPTPDFEELCVGAGELRSRNFDRYATTHTIVVKGGKCGATYLDRNFHKLLIDRFGRAFEDVLGRFKGPGSRFMMEFEKAKHSFGSADNDTYEIGPIPLGTGHCPEHFDEEEEYVCDSVQVSSIRLSHAGHLPGSQHVLQARYGDHLLPCHQGCPSPCQVAGDQSFLRTREANGGMWEPFLTV